MAWNGWHVGVEEAITWIYCCPLVKDFGNNLSLSLSSSHSERIKLLHTIGSLKSATGKKIPL